MNKFKRTMAVILLVMVLIASFTVPAFAATKKANFTTTGNVFIRKGPGLNYGKVGEIAKGVTITGTDYAKDSRGVYWVYTKVNGVSGWVSNTYLKKGGKTPKTTQTVKAVTGKTYIRKGPGKEYKILTTLQKGKSATYLGKRSTDERGVYWYKVSYNGFTGWVSDRYTELY